MPTDPMLPTRRALLGALPLLPTLLASCAIRPQPLSFDAWAEAFSADWVRLSPERATATQYFDGAEQARLDSELTPLTESRRARQQALARDGLAQLRGFVDAGRLDAGQRIAAGTLQWGLERSLAGEPYQDHGFVFDQFGLQVRLPSFLGETHPLRNAADVEHYLARLAQVAVRIDEGLSRARSAAARGLLPPNFIVERSRSQVEAFLKPAVDDNVFVVALARRSATLKDLPAAARQRALEQARDLVSGQVRPAYSRLAAWLAELHPRTGSDAGLWRLPDGAAAYAQALANYTTTPLDAGQIHAIGLREVARIEGEMDRVLRGLGHHDGSVALRLEAMRKATQPPPEPDPRPQLLQRYTEAVRDNERRSAALFGLKPKAPVEVRRVPPLTERVASAYYTTPAPDGSRPGVFWVPLPGPVFNTLGLRSLAVHEAVPGHHFQLAVQQELQGLPRWRQQRIFGGGSAHTEGWALYAERLALDHGWYDGDPLGHLGALDAQLFRARRLVVDTGLHARRWTRQQAIDYGVSASEVERYVANPGQACAYMIGMLRLLELRDKARAALGARFDLVAFHDLVLRTGSVPLDVLGQAVDQWLAAPPRA